jgi:hypothetical protein
MALIAAPGCAKKPPPVEALPPPPPPVDAGVVQLVPIDDAGDAAPEAAGGPARPHGHAGPSTNSNTARIRLCCNAIRGEAKKLGAAPEAMVMMGIAAQCDVLAVQASSGSAPEFGQVRQLLKGRTIPNACAGM